MANIGNMMDLEFAVHYQADGIGLFRTELPFIIGNHFFRGRTIPNLSEAVERVNRRGDHRTLDFGGDKFLVSLRPERTLLGIAPQGLFKGKRC
jgi:signal transduction protein with GAF and PtsI domain